MKTLILYGSFTGNTQFVAEEISQDLKRDKIEHDLVNASEFSPQKIKDYDLLILGSSTWDDGHLQYDFEEFFQEIQDLNLANKKFVAFGCGDSNYEEFCKAVDLIEDFWIKKGAEKINKGLRIDSFPQMENNQKLIKDWLTELKSKLV